MNHHTKIKAEVEKFFSKHAPEESILVLDSTGLSVTKHYLVLSSIGEQRFRSFREIHGYSGGVFAYFGYTAYLEGMSKFPIEYYHENFDLAFRRAHHPKSFARTRSLYNLLTARTFNFGNESIERLISFIFKEEFLRRPLSSFPSSFVPFVALSETGEILSARSVSEALTVRDVLCASIKVPFFYGKSDTDKLFDAAYGRNYKDLIFGYRHGENPCLVSSPWKSGIRNSCTYLKCVESKNPQREMMRDFLALALNLPNKKWNQDFKMAFVKDAERLSHARSN